MSKDRILIVEDDENLAFIMKRIIESNDYNVWVAVSVAEALSVMKEQSFDLILLDMMLPDGQGTEVCKEIRKDSFCPILFVSCLGDSDTKVKALEMGGDDYIQKPVDYNELMARIQTNIRRARQYNLGRSASAEEFYPGMVIKRNKHEVWLTDDEKRPVTKVDLSPIEYQLLVCLSEKPGELFLYHEIYQKVWGDDDLGDVRTVMVHVSNLRKKMGECGKELIRTVRSAGYIFGSG